MNPHSGTVWPFSDIEALVELRRMKKVAVFGNAAGGRSTLARSVAALTGLPLYTLWSGNGQASPCTS
jgi:hypothetical protein